MTGYWWCSECKEEKSPQRVTHGENCTDCGNRVIWKGMTDQTAENDEACRNCPKALECVSTDCPERFVPGQTEEEKLIEQIATNLGLFLPLPQYEKIHTIHRARIILGYVKQAGYKSPEEVADIEHRATMDAFAEWEKRAKANGFVQLDPDQTLPDLSLLPHHLELINKILKDYNFKKIKQE